MQVKRLQLRFAGILACLLPLALWAQTGVVTLTGRVVEAGTGEPLVGVTVLVRGLQTGASTDLNGYFEIKRLPAGEYSIDFSFIGYKTLTRPVDLKGTQQLDLGTLELTTNEIGIEEVQVIASISDNDAPLATTTLSEAQILQRTNPGVDYPELMRFSPSVYVSRSGGGYGDSRISIRGFDQENLAVLVNGVPVNDMEFGNIFWVNWAGLDAVTRTTQIQRGLGVSKLAVNSVGGTMNIITKTTDQEAGGRVSFETTSALTSAGESDLSPYLYRTGFFVSTGLLGGGWAVSFQGYRVSGEGYFEEQFVDFWSYFLSVSKQMGKNHLLVFTAVGSPQRHGENLAPQLASTWEERGYRYNPNWGRRSDGEVQSYENFYHKPQITLNHYWTLNPTTNLNTSVYYSYGTGGGSFLPFGPRTADGQWDVALIEQINSTIPDTTLATDNRGVVTGRAAQFWETNFRLDQFWTGAISTLDWRPKGDFEFIFGVDLRYFEGDQFFEVADLYGADFLIDGSSIRQPVRAVGVDDQIFQSKLSQIGWMGTFGQVEYEKDDLSAFVSASYIRNNYRRQDRFLYLEGQGDVSPWTSYDNFSVKGGLRYNLTNEHAVFVNGGYFTRAPFFGVVFGNDNEPEAIPNEKIKSAELGYEINMRNFRASINAYYTDYEDRSLNIERFTDPVSGMEGSALISGIGGRHVGIEGDANWFPLPWLSLGGFFSFGDWVLEGDAEGTLLDVSRQTVGTSPLYYDDLYVGNSAQTVLGAEATVRYADRLNVRLSTVYYGKLYSEVGNRVNPNDRAQPYKMPSYYLVDFSTSYNVPFSEKLGGEFKIVVNNVLDRLFLSEGRDAVNHDLTDTGFFVGMGRTLSLSFALKF